MQSILEFLFLIILSKNTRVKYPCIFDSVINQIKGYKVITNNQRLERKYKMRAYTHFDSLRRARLISKEDMFPLLSKQWKIAGGISFYINALDDDIWVHVPNGFITTGPHVSGIIRRFISPKSRVFKAGIIHDYLLTKRKIKIKSYTFLANKKEADVIFLQAMQAAGVPIWQQVLMFYAAKLFSDTDKSENLF